MATLTLRNTKGTPLTNAEVDNNFQYLNNALGAAGSSTIPTPSGTGSPVLTTSPSINTPTLNSPILVTPTIGTPTSGNLSNCTGLPISSGVSGLATGISTFLTTPSSANLLSAMTTKTGTGSLVFNTNTTLAGTTSADSLTLNSPLAIASGGTNATDRATALTNILPSASGVTPGYVLATAGPGTYYWAAGGSGGGTVGSGGGTSVQTSRKIVTATSGQTVFTGLGAYTPNIGQLRVYINGVRQFPSDYNENVTTLSSVVITGTTGQFSCASTTLTNGQTISITGIFGGTGSITNYISGKLYYVIATNGSTTFTLSETLSGTAITTTAGTPTGLTYTTGYGFTLTSGATAGEVVMAEVDSYYSYVQLAASTTYSASGALTANNVQNAIDQLETNKLAKAGGTMTGGSVNSTTIGATTPSTGKFTSLEYTGALTGSTDILNIGSGQIYKDASGNVGIGTTSVIGSAKLSILGAGTVTSFAALTTSGIAINSLNTSLSTYALQFFDYRNENNIPVTNNAVDLNTDGSSSWSVSTTPAGSRASDRRVERMRIDASGNVGIGTSTPSDKLSVGGIIYSGVGGFKFPDSTVQTTAALNGVGIGQTWINVTASRASGTTYTNSTGKPIVITVVTTNSYPNTATCTFTINGSSLASMGNPSGVSGYSAFTLGWSTIVPTGATYSASISSYSSWWELR